MARTLIAAALLALCVVSSAERSLLAHKANGGSSLHAVVLGTYTGGPGASQYPYYTSGLATAQQVSTYLTTNGNGSWTYTEGTSSPRSMLNPALYTAFNRQGSSIGLAAGSYSTVMSVTGLIGAGINGLAFPSLKLGIAVGASPGNMTASTPNYWPSILTTQDLGLTWQWATGFTGAPAGFSLTGSTTYPDLTSVYCVSRTLCFAVGGYLPSNAAWSGVYYDQVGPVASPNNNNGLYPGLGTGGSTYFTNTSFPWAIGTQPTNCGNSAATPGCGQFSNTAGLISTYGTVLVSTNGGTQWTFLPVGTISGLYAVSADSSGKHVYAVGATSGVVNGSALANVALQFYSQTPTIIYSGNYGQSWVNQTAPVIPQATYQLLSVFVLRGTIAYAAGGNLFSQNGIGALAQYGFGTIVATFNGGFTWSQQPIISFNTSAGPFTNAAFGNGAGIPVINSIAFITPKTGTSVGKYVGWAVGENGLILKTVSGVPIKTLSNPYPTIPVNTQFQWSALTSASAAAYPLTTLYPAGNAVTSFPLTFSFYEIVWDNNAVGYIYGMGIILSTHNLGATWQPETPSQVSSYGVLLSPAANVPTTF